MFDLRRREFITLLGGAAATWPLVARAQQPTKMLRVGTVAGTPKSSPQWVAFERRMGELGYQEGKNFSFDFLQAASADEYELLYRKLTANAPDVILAIGPEIGLKSALAATRTLPIVMIAIDYDPLARGYVTSLARPSGNITGLFFQQIELAAKPRGRERRRVRNWIPEACGERARRHPGYWPGNRPEVGARRYADAADRDDCHRLRSARPWLRDKPGAALRQCYRRCVPADRTRSKADSAHQGWLFG